MVKSRPVSAYRLVSAGRHHRYCSCWLRVEADSDRDYRRRMSAVLRQHYGDAVLIKDAKVH